MIRNLLATTAIATLVATGAVAQTSDDASAPTTQNQQQQQQQQNQQQQMSIRAEGHLASNLMGESVYNGSGEDAENIGDVTDLVISNDGSVEAVVVGVGGFLGIGQKEVALEYNLVQWEQQQQDGERRIVVQTTADALESQQEFDRTAYRPMPSDADVAQTTPASEEDLASAPQQQDQQQQQQQTDQTAVSPLESSEDEDSQTTAAVTEDQQSSDTAATTETQQQTDSDADVVIQQDTQDGQETAQTAQTAQTEQPADQSEDVTVTQDTASQDQQTGDQQQTAQSDTGMAEDQQADQTQEEPTADQQADQQQTAQTEQTGDQAQGTDQVQTGAVNQDQLQQAQPDQIRAENLTGTQVYGVNEEEIGQIGDVILTPEGEVDAVIVDVGGFLGIGQKEVAMAIDNLAFMTNENGDLYLYTQFTQEQLEAQPEYNQATYAEQRDQMRLEAQ